MTAEQEKWREDVKRAADNAQAARARIEKQMNHLANSMEQIARDVAELKALINERLVK